MPPAGALQLRDEWELIIPPAIDPGKPASLTDGSTADGMISRHSYAQRVPHPCQNGREMGVNRGHSRGAHPQPDLERGKSARSPPGQPR
jgi:hypothetical protein